MVMKGVTAADIGTDHAFLPILLIQHHICSKVYACDVAEGPLCAAKENIQKAGLDNEIVTILSDGLHNVPEDADACIIAGMGCLNAVQILEAASHRIQNMKQIIVEVNRDTAKMREWISSHHYTIMDEIYVNERNHDYIVIAFLPQEHAQYTKEEILLGPVLMQRREPAYLDYCQRTRTKIDHILQQSQGNAYQQKEVEDARTIYQKYLDK